MMGAKRLVGLLRPASILSESVSVVWHGILVVRHVHAAVGAAVREVLKLWLFLPVKLSTIPDRASRISNAAQGEFAP